MDDFSMPRPLFIGQTAPRAVTQGITQLGARIRLARKRRALKLRDLSARAGMAYDTARAVENGNLSTGIGAYFALIWALGLEGEFKDFMNPEHDIEGKQLELSRLPTRVRATTAADDEDF